MNRANEGSVNNDNSAVSFIAMTVNRELEVVAGGKISRNSAVENGMDITVNKGELDDKGIIYNAEGRPVIRVPVSAKEIKHLIQRRKEKGIDDNYGERDDG